MRASFFFPNGRSRNFHKDLLLIYFCISLINLRTMRVRFSSYWISRTAKIENKRAHTNHSQWLSIHLQLHANVGKQFKPINTSKCCDSNVGSFEWSKYTDKLREKKEEKYRFVWQKCKIYSRLLYFNYLEQYSLETKSTENRCFRWVAREIFSPLFRIDHLLILCSWESRAHQNKIIINKL